MSEGSKKEMNLYRPPDNLDPDLQKELDEALGDMSLEQIIDADQAGKTAGARAAVGKGVRKGRVVSIQADDMFIDMGGKSQGILPTSQFSAEEAMPKPGDLVDVTIEGYSSQEGLLLLSREGAVLAAAWETLEEGHIVEGRVTGHNKGGLELTINGIRAFMPISQIEMYRVEDLAPYVDKRLRAQVTEVDVAEQNVIVSRRALLEIEEAANREKAWETLAEGQVVTGTVRNIMPYGAFVTLGNGIDGLLHVGDMAYHRVEDPKTIVKEGQEVKVKVLKIDKETRKISLGLKQTLTDPWTGIEGKYRADAVVSGRITRLADFGAFFELEPGVEGLIPISEMSFERRIKHPSEVVKENDNVKVRVMSVDPEKKRISLSLKRVGDDPWTGASVRWAEGALVTGVVRRIAEFGAFIEITPGVEGLVHISEISATRIRAVSDELKEGQAVQAKVLSVDEAARRISLSIKQVQTMAEYTGAPAAADAAEPETPPPPPPKRKKPLKGGLD